MTTNSAVARNPIEAMTIRKLRTRILPLILVLFVIAVIDRNNIGFAALTMNRELAISSQQYGFLAGIFFFGYFIFEVPSNLMLHKVGARVWIARILISWGIVAILTGLAKTVTHLYVLRFLLGVAEAGYFPGIALYLTYWFPQRQLAKTIALFLTANPVANIVGAPISGAILDHIHWFGISSWRWLLVLEGVPALLGGILTYFLLPGRPAEAQFLSPAERKWITAELAREEQQKLATQRITTSQVLAHPRIWHLTAIYFLAMIGHYTMAFWMPQILKSWSSQYSNTAIGLLVMVPYLLGLPVMILVGRSSDRTLERRYHAAAPLAIGAISLLLLGTTATPTVAFSVILWGFVASGVCSLWGPFWSLPNEFLAGYSAAAGIALINCFGNLGGFVGSYAIGTLNKKTGGFHAALVFVGLSLFTSAILILVLQKRSAHPAPAAAAAGEPILAGLPTAETD